MHPNSNLILTSTIVTAPSVNTLNFEALKIVQNKNMHPISTRAGACYQTNDVIYTLQNSQNRVPTLREKMLEYFRKEMMAYLKGVRVVDAENGLGHASKYWFKIANHEREINSNYGHYIFFQEIPGRQEIFPKNTQFFWAAERLVENIHTRRAIININQLHHKQDEEYIEDHEVVIENSRDFPCTVSLQFQVIENKLHCIANARSTDIITGLPYDIAFFSFVNELMYRHLKQNYSNVNESIQILELGPTVMKSECTQIYENALAEKAIKEIIGKTYFKLNKAWELQGPWSVGALIHDLSEHISSVEKNNGADNFDRNGSTYPNEIAATDPMPQITDANLVLHEIYSKEKPTSEVMKWVYQ